MHELLGTGLYPLHQAARLVREEPRTVRRWLRGYSWKGRPRSEPLWRTDYADEDLPGGKVISFRDLLELRMVAQFVQHGVDLRIIRATIDMARDDLDSAYPLSNRTFLTDGKRIFMKALEESSGDEKMVDILRKQFVFSHIIKASLFQGIEYGAGGPTRWYPEARKRDVALDPEIQFGAPILAKVGIPTDTIFAAWKAEKKDRAAVAREFDITPAMVSAAVGFEQRLDS